MSCPSRTGLRLLLVLALPGVAAARAQTPTPQSPEPPSAAPGAAAQEPAPPAPTPHFIQLEYPRDKEYVIALVDGEPLWLQHLVQHIDERHYPGFLRLLEGPDGTGSPEGRRILQSDLMAHWVRNFADCRAMAAVAKARGDGAPGVREPSREGVPTTLEECQSAALKRAFEDYLKSYVEGRQKQGLSGQLSQRTINNVLSDWQMRQGLACELQGWMDWLEPVREWTNQQLNDFFQEHPRYFGGGVTIAHILIQNRDAGTCILLEKDGRMRAERRLAEVQRRLLPDGSNFEDLARQFSDDTRTGRDGGILKHVERFDQRLPAAICRAAWSMADGQVSDVIETQYGWHLVKRIENVQRMWMLFSDATLPMVRQLKQRELQEDLLFAARKQYRVELRL